MRAINQPKASTRILGRRTAPFYIEPVKRKRRFRTAAFCGLSVARGEGGKRAEHGMPYGVNTQYLQQATDAFIVRVGL